MRTIMIVVVLVAVLASTTSAGQLGDEVRDAGRNLEAADLVLRNLEEQARNAGLGEAEDLALRYLEAAGLIYKAHRDLQNHEGTAGLSDVGATVGRVHRYWEAGDLVLRYLKAANLVFRYLKAADLFYDAHRDLQNLEVALRNLEEGVRNAGLGEAEDLALRYLEAANLVYKAHRDLRNHEGTAGLSDVGAAVGRVHRYWESRDLALRYMKAANLVHKAHRDLRNLEDTDLVLPNLEEKVDDEVIVLDNASVMAGVLAPVGVGGEAGCKWYEICDVESIPIVGQTLEKLGDEVRNAGRGFDEIITQPLGDLVIDPVVRAMKRCHDRAEREPDPEKKQALVDECNNRKTGDILGYVGLAVGSVWGVPGMAAGSAIGSVVGSAIDGSPNIAVRVLVDVPESSTPARPEQPDADDGGAPSAPSPDRSPASQRPRTARLVPNPWMMLRRAGEANMLNDGEEDDLREYWRERWRAQRDSEYAKLDAAVRDMNTAWSEAENTMLAIMELATDLCVGDDCVRLCETDPGGRACDKARQ